MIFHARCKRNVRAAGKNVMCQSSRQHITTYFQDSGVDFSEIIAKFAYMKLIELNLKRILDLCKKHKVKTLSVFGSILTDRFNEQSDVDLLVDFEPIDHDKFDYVGNYFDLKDSLEQLFQRKVDLIEYGKNLNPIFKALVDKKKHLIYG